MKLIGYTCTYNEEEYVDYAMPYVEAMHYDKFIVYDNGSTDRTVELLSKYPFVEIRTYDTNGVFDVFKRRDLLSQCFWECKEMSYDGELIAFTWTDFDEVLLWAGDVDIKAQMEVDYWYRGYNCFYKNMINILPPTPDFDTKSAFEANGGGFVHMIDGMRGSVWIDGMKPTMLIVNDFDNIEFYPGNHYAIADVKEGKVIKNYDDTCRMYGFHLKFIDKAALEKKTAGYTNRDLDIAKKMMPEFDLMFRRQLAVSFPIEEYFLHDFFNSKLGKDGTEWNGLIKRG